MKRYILMSKLMMTSALLSLFGYVSVKYCYGIEPGFGLSQQTCEKIMYYTGLASFALASAIFYVTIIIFLIGLFFSSRSEKFDE